MAPHNSTASVQVLISTFNGKKFLKDQLDSLRSQTGVNVRVLARDDGSIDGTREFLLNYAKQWPALEILPSSQNLGVVGSFFELLKHADEACDTFAFCDQDDVWLPEKLSHATQKLAPRGVVPALYFSRLQYVDEKLEPIGSSLIPRFVSFESALVENVATGCSIVMNRALLQEIKLNPPAKNCLMHDWWAYLVALSTGEAIYDSNSRVLYRQHSANVVGASANWMTVYLTKWRRFWSRPKDSPKITDQSMEFLRLFETRLSFEKRKLLNDFVNSRHGGLWGRFCYAWSMPVRRQSKLDNFLLRVLILLGRY